MSNGTCPACQADFKAGENCAALRLYVPDPLGINQTSALYCPGCTQKIMGMPYPDLFERFANVVSDKIRRPIPISEGLVREIALNLGASAKLQDALIERIFGKDWTGAPPEDSGLVMNKYANRDRLVAFVAATLKDLWTLEA